MHAFEFQGAIHVLVEITYLNVYILVSCYLWWDSHFGIQYIVSYMISLFKNMKNIYKTWYISTLNSCLIGQCFFIFWPSKEK